MNILLNLKEMVITNITNYNTYNSKIILTNQYNNNNNSLVSSSLNKKYIKPPIFKKSKIQMRFF